MKKSLTKKLIMFLCVISMLFSMTACGGDSKSDKKSSSKKTEESDEKKVSKKKVIEEEEVEEVEEVEDYEDVYEEPEDIEEEDLEAEVEMVTGVTSGNTYENYFFGYGVTLGADWNMKTQKEIEIQREQTIGLAGGADNIKAAFDVTITDMMAVNANGYDTINVGIEKPNVDPSLYTEDDYVKSSKDPACQALEQMGLENVECQDGTYTIQGESHAAGKIHGTYNGEDVYELLIVVKEGEYISVITVCTWGTDSTDEIAQNIYLL